MDKVLMNQAEAKVDIRIIHSLLGNGHGTVDHVPYPAAAAICPSLGGRRIDDHHIDDDRFIRFGRHLLPLVQATGIWRQNRQILLVAARQLFPLMGIDVQKEMALLIRLVTNFKKLMIGSLTERT